MNKQALTEALAYFDANEQAFRMSDLKTYVDAARLVERLLPGECETCKGTGSTFDDPNCYACTCPVCHGTGQVWDEGIVEAIGTITTDPRWAHIESPLLLEFALAVLSALVELLTEKVKR